MIRTHDKSGRTVATTPRTTPTIPMPNITKAGSGKVMVVLSTQSTAKVTVSPSQQRSADRRGLLAAGLVTLQSQEPLAEGHGGDE